MENKFEANTQVQCSVLCLLRMRSGVPPACFDKMWPRYCLPALIKCDLGFEVTFGNHFFLISFSPYKTSRRLLFGQPYFKQISAIHSKAWPNISVPCLSYCVGLSTGPSQAVRGAMNFFTLLPSDFCEGHNLSKGVHRSKSSYNGIKPVSRLEGVRKKWNHSNCSAPRILPHPPSDVRSSLPKFLYLWNRRRTGTHQGTASKNGGTEQQQQHQVQVVLNNQVRNMTHPGNSQLPTAPSSFCSWPPHLLSGAIRRPLEQDFLAPLSHKAVPGTQNSTEHLPANTHTP